MYSEVSRGICTTLLYEEEILEKLCNRSLCSGAHVVVDCYWLSWIRFVFFAEKGTQATGLSSVWP